MMWIIIRLVDPTKKSCNRRYYHRPHCIDWGANYKAEDKKKFQTVFYVQIKMQIYAQCFRRFFKTLKERTVIEYRICRFLPTNKSSAQITLFLQCILHQVMFPRSSRNFLQKTCAEHAMNREMGLISYFIIVWKKLSKSVSFAMPRTGFYGHPFCKWIRKLSKSSNEGNETFYVIFKLCEVLCKFFIVSSRL